MPQVPVEPLFAQHRNERGEQRYQETCVHEPSDGDNLTGGTFLGGWNGGGFIWDSRLIEGEEDCAEESYGLLVWIRL